MPDSYVRLLSIIPLSITREPTGQMDIPFLICALFSFAMRIVL